MSEILCSTGALIGRFNNRNYRLLKELKSELRCDGFEFMVYPAWYEELDKLVPFLQDAKLNIPVMHCEKGIGELISNDDKEAFIRFELNCQIAKSIGAEKLVFHLWNGTTSDKYIDRNISACEKLMTIAEKYGRKLLIENVVCNRKDPMTHWIKLAETYPDIGFIFDTKMADFHRQLDDFYAHKELHEKVLHYHVNDFAGAYMDWENLWVLPIGKGHIDWDKFFDHIKERDYDGTFTTESTALDRNGVINTQMLNEQFDFIRNKLKSKLQAAGAYLAAVFIVSKMGLVFRLFIQIFPPYSTEDNVETVEYPQIQAKISPFVAVFDILLCGKLCGKVKTYVNSGKPDFYRQ